MSKKRKTRICFSWNQVLKRKFKFFSEYFDRLSSNFSVIKWRCAVLFSLKNLVSMIFVWCYEICSRQKKTYFDIAIRISALLIERYNIFQRNNQIHTPICSKLSQKKFQVRSVKVSRRKLQVIFCPYDLYVSYKQTLWEFKTRELRVRPNPDSTEPRIRIQNVYFFRARVHRCNFRPDLYPVSSKLFIDFILKITNK